MNGAARRKYHLANVNEIELLVIVAANFNYCQKQVLIIMETALSMLGSKVIIQNDPKQVFKNSTYINTM